MKNIGLLIKEERTIQNMKQSFLAKGICSVSYLSKIENHNVQASDEIIALLLRKLNIELETLYILTEEEENKLKDKLLNIYNEITIKKDTIFAKEKIRQIENELRGIPINTNVVIYKNLILLRLFLTLADKEKCDEYINKILSIECEMVDFQQYLFLKLQAIYFYQNQNIERSLSYVEKISGNYPLSALEEADLNYVRGLIYLADNQFIKAIERLEISAKYFNTHFHMPRAVECYISLGVAYKRLNVIQKAEEIYLLAMKIVNELKIEKFKGIIYHNLGVLYSHKGDSQTAIDYYQNSILNKKDNTRKLLTVLYILKELAKDESTIKEQKYWITYGESICDLCNSIHEEYIYHFNIFKELHNQNLSNKTIKKLVYLLREKQDYEHLSYYNNAFADYFYNQGQYKIAANYYKSAYLYSLEILN